MPIIQCQIVKFLLVILFFITINAYSQEISSKHKILKGETISSIARDNNVAINDIYKLNPTVKKVLKLNSIILIPISRYKIADKSSKSTAKIIIEKTHTVLPKETLYRISKKYNTSIEILKKWNPSLENEKLEIGQILNVTNTTTAKTENLEAIKTADNRNIENFIHEVLPKETKYSLAKKYKTTIQDLEQWNPEIVNNLPIGYKLIIKKTTENIYITALPEKIAVNPDSIKIIARIDEIVTKSQPTIATEIAQEKDSTAVIKPVLNSELSISLEQRAVENIGTKYQSGGCRPGGFDCSGLMIYTFQNSGITLPRTSAEQSKFGITIDKSEAQKGDLIFFSTNGRGNVNHVGMVVESADGELKFIHSSIHSGVIISSTAETYYKKTFKHINRVLPSSIFK